jgi:hypothetical protein
MHASKYLTVAIIKYLAALFCVLHAKGLARTNNFSYREDVVDEIAFGLCLIAGIMVIAASFFLYKHIQESKK